jgi:hypothetical protein
MKFAEIELEDHSHVILPKRSRLYRLPPVNPLTGSVESLTSYIARLSAAHCLPLWVLVTREIAPLFSRKSIVDFKNGHCDLLGKFGGAVNGNNSTAAEAVKAVEHLTTQNGVREMTMRMAGGNVAATPLLRPTQAWCPQCLQEWSECGQELYYPLVWNLADVQFCAGHQIALVNLCGGCHRTHYPLSRRLRIGRCPHCNSRLGCSQINTQPGPAIRPSPWQLFSATAAAVFIRDLARTPSISGTRAAHFRVNLAAIVAQLFGGSKNAFATYVGVHHMSVGDWLVGKQKPSLRALLLFAYRFGISPSTLLLAPLKENEATLGRPALLGDNVSLRPPLRRIAANTIEQTLRAALEKPTWPPTSLKTICSKGGFHQTQASRRFPELAREISELYRSHWAEKRRQEKYFMKILVRSAVYEVCWSGEYPSLSKVAAQLAPGISLRDPTTKAEMRAVIEELGLRNSAKWNAAEND